MAIFLNSFFGDLFTNLVANVIWLALGIAVTFGGRYLFIIRPARRLWNFEKHKTLVICTSTTKTDTGLYQRPSTGIGQVRALVFIITSLNRAFKSIDTRRILLSEEEIRHYIENDLILLGGPKNNQVTRLFFEKFDSYNILMQEISGAIYWQKTNTKYSGEVKDDKVTVDYGIIIRMNNIFCTGAETKLVLFSGVHTYGTVAAAKYFCEHMHKKLKLDIKANVAILVSCTIVDGYPVDIRLVDHTVF